VNSPLRDTEKFLPLGDGDQQLAIGAQGHWFHS
jgi:hypothetical protein